MEDYRQDLEDINKALHEVECSVALLQVLRDDISGGYLLLDDKSVINLRCEARSRLRTAAESLLTG